MELNNSELVPRLKQLKLSGMLVTLAARQREAEVGQWGFSDFLSRLLEDEIERRAQGQLAERIKKANLNTTLTLENFDWNFNPTINRQQIMRLASGDYLRQHTNVLVVGPTGTGKSRIASGLAHEACRQGQSVLFVNTHKMLVHLKGGRADHSLERRLATYTKPDLLVLDDFGLKAVEPPGSEDLYDVIAARHGVGSILLTSNRAPEEWPQIFSDPLLASAGLDRLADHAETLVISGRSYRAEGPKT
jgi:DNA replication protein DnaC